MELSFSDIQYFSFSLAKENRELNFTHLTSIEKLTPMKNGLVHPGPDKTSAIKANHSINWCGSCSCPDVDHPLPYFPSFLCCHVSNLDINVFPRHQI